MLLGSGLPKYLWTEAVFAAVYIVNHTPTNALHNSIPAEKWKRSWNEAGRKQDKSIWMFGLCLNSHRID